MPEDTASEAVSAPLMSKCPAPEEAVPIPKYVTVDELPVHCGKAVAPVLAA
jgi:hypothetical protein